MWDKYFARGAIASINRYLLFRLRLIDGSRKYFVYAANIDELVTQITIKLNRGSKTQIALAHGTRSFFTHIEIPTNKL